jgi:hypothetical protein
MAHNLATINSTKQRGRGDVFYDLPPPTRKWYIYHFNCNCTAYNVARLTPVKGTWPRCIYCRKTLGHMDFDKLGEVKAKTEREALSLIGCGASHSAAGHVGPKFSCPTSNP